MTSEDIAQRQLRIPAIPELKGSRAYLINILDENSDSMATNQSHSDREGGPVMDRESEDLYGAGNHADADRLAVTRSGDSNPDPLGAVERVLTRTGNSTPDPRGAVKRVPSRPTSPTEEQSLQNALQASLQDYQERVEPPRSAPIATTQPVGVQEQLQKMMHDIPFFLSNELEPLRVKDADTLVYIGSPPREPHQSAVEYNSVRKHFENIHLCSSSALKVLDSPYFTKCLGPMSLRAERRLRKDGVLRHTNIPAGIKYYIDLRPPGEDDEAVILVTDLTCTQGVLQWRLAGERYDIPGSLILGNDNFNIGPRRISIPSQTPADEKNSNSKADEKSKAGTTLVMDTGNVTLPVTQQAQSNTAKNPSSEDKPTTPNIEQTVKLEPEYSAVRHRSGIERLLYAIHGLNPKLDSAPKVWTFYALAKYFNCATNHLVSGWICSWLYSGANLNFVQCNPEVVYRIGMGIQSPQLVQATYSLLVGEKALMQVYGEYDTKKVAPRAPTIHGRRLELLDDDEKNRVDHGATALIRRVRSELGDLTRNGMTWMYKSSEYLKILSLSADTVEQNDKIQYCISLLRDYVRGRMYWILCKMQDGLQRELDHRARSCSSFRTGIDEEFFAVYNRLNQPTRIFTRTFWFALRSADFEKGYQNTCDPDTNISSWSNLAQHMAKVYPQDPDNGILEIGYKRLTDSVDALNSIILARVYPSPYVLPQARQNEEPQKLTWFHRNTRPVVGAANPLQDGDNEASTTAMTASPEKRRKISTESGERDRTSALVDAWNERWPNTTRDDHAVWNVQGSRFGAQPLQSGTNDSSPKSPVTLSPKPFLGNRTDPRFSPWTEDEIASRRSVKAPTTAPPVHVALKTMMMEFSSILAEKCNDMLYPAHLFMGEEQLPVNLVDTLMCMEESEKKYLPLWADGFDDGTGGVFDDVDVPNLEAGGFKGGKRGYGVRPEQNMHSAESVFDSDASSFDDVAGEAVSTVGRASRDATDGTETVKSIASDAESQSEFMRQDELYEEIRDMKMQQELKHGNGKGKGRATDAQAAAADSMDDFMDADDMDGDVSTVMGAGSDTQGHMFGEMDSDGGQYLDDEDVHGTDTQTHQTAGQLSLPLRGVAHHATEVESEDDDFEMV